MNFVTTSNGRTINLALVREVYRDDTDPGDGGDPIVTLVLEFGSNETDKMRLYDEDAEEVWAYISSNDTYIGWDNDKGAS